jgi:hypothetical protein
VQELANYGLAVDPNLELRRGEGLWSYYNLDDGHIYISVPDMKAATGELHVLLLRSMLGCETNEELDRLSRFLVPYYLAHELAHHLRQRYGQFGEDLWHEEQVANELAIALNKRRLSPDERAEIERLLQRAIDGRSGKAELAGAGITSYRNLWQALQVSGALSHAALDRIQYVHSMFAIDPEDMLRSSGQLSDTLDAQVKQRQTIIDQINTEYADDMMLYLYYHLSWLQLDLTYHEYQYITAFAREHLDVAPPLLPSLPETSEPTSDAILGCFQAYQQMEPVSDVGREYFYRRYRALLLARLQLVELDSPSHTTRLHKEVGFVLHSYEPSEPDVLAYLAHLAPPSLQDLFPHKAPLHPRLPELPASALPTETDRRLRAHIMGDQTDSGSVDQAAANTLSLLKVLYQIDAFRSLPAEVWLDLAHAFCTVKLDAGETLIWLGDDNNDVYIPIRGNLAVLVNEDGEELEVARIQPRELVGEIAFLTRSEREATVRATEPAECLVLGGTDLLLLAFRCPDILVAMGRVLSRRLADMNVALARASVG